MQTNKFRNIFLFAAFYTAVWIALDLMFRFALFDRVEQIFWSQLYTKSILLSYVSAIAVLAISSLLARIAKPMAWIFIAIIAVLYTSDLVSNYYTMNFFNSYLSKFHISFVTQDPQYLVNALATYPTMFQYFSIFIVFVIFASPALIYLKKSAGGLKHLFALSGSLTVYIFFFFQMIQDNRHFILLPNINSSVQAVLHGIDLYTNKDNPLVLLREHKKIVVPNQKPITDTIKTIVLIVNESWGKDYFPFPTDGRSGMNLTASRLADPGKKFFYFENAFSNSTATDVSWPAILTGIAPNESTEVLHSFPMSSNLAKQSGFKTALFSSWRLEWANIMPFLRGGRFDTITGASEMGLPIVNDLGIDDMETSIRISNFIKNDVKSDEKLFLIFATNGLHQPYQTKSEHLPAPDPALTKYESALNVVDQAIEGVMKTLEETGRFESALIFLTSDHSDGLKQKNKVIRITSFYDYFIKIPFLVKLPSDLPEGMTTHLKNNLMTNIQNLDIAPTLAHVLGYCFGENHHPFCDIYKGSSLFTTISTDRTLVALNTNDVRKWVPEGFGIFKENQRIMFSSSEPEMKAFDVENDPAQATNIWNQLPDQDREEYRRIVRKERHLKRIVDTYGKDESLKKH